MKKIIFVSILFVVLSCSNSTKRGKNPSPTSDGPDKMELKRDSAQREISVSPDLNFGYPGNNATLEMWKEKVRKEGDPYYYEQLDNYYSEHKDSQNEIIKFTEIMINKHRNNKIYLYDFFIHVKGSNSKNKAKLMQKAIGYLKRITSGNDIMSIQAKYELAQIYREGIYVKKDTIKAEYYEKLLKKNSRR